MTIKINFNDDQMQMLFIVVLVGAILYIFCGTNNSLDNFSVGAPLPQPCGADCCKESPHNPTRLMQEACRMSDEGEGLWHACEWGWNEATREKDCHVRLSGNLFKNDGSGVRGKLKAELTRADPDDEDPCSDPPCYTCEPCESKIAGLPSFNGREDEDRCWEASGECKYYGLSEDGSAEYNSYGETPPNMNCCKKDTKRPVE